MIFMDYKNFNSYDQIFIMLKKIEAKYSFSIFSNDYLNKTH
jgi:hypothetical protein